MTGFLRVMGWRRPCPAAVSSAAGFFLRPDLSGVKKGTPGWRGAPFFMWPESEPTVPSVSKMVTAPKLRPLRRLTESIFGKGCSIIGTPGGFEYRKRFSLPGLDRRWGWQIHSCGLLLSQTTMRRDSKQLEVEPFATLSLPSAAPCCDPLRRVHSFSNRERIAAPAAECSPFVADPLLWKAVKMWIFAAIVQHENKGERADLRLPPLLLRP